VARVESRDEGEGEGERGVKYLVSVLCIEIDQVSCRRVGMDLWRLGYFALGECCVIWLTEF